MSKFFVCDIYAHSSEHSMFVESFIDYFEDINDVTYLLNETHSKYVKSEHKVFKFFFKDELCKSSIARLFNREVMKSFRLFTLLPYILFSRRKLVVLGTSNIQTYLVSLLKYLPFFTASIVLHSHPESLVKPPKERRKLGGVFIRAFGKIHNSKKFNILVLGAHIKENLAKLGYDGIFSIPHPVPKSSLVEFICDKYTTNSTHHIAMVGLIRNDTKNCNEIYNLKLDKTVHAHVIGRAKPDFPIIANDTISFKLWDHIYTDEEFIKEIENIHSFIYFFGESDYKFTASATALDAIIYGKAVFSLRNQSVASLLSDYPLFFQFDTVDDMSDAINNFDLSLLNTVDFNYQRERFLINNFERELNIWLK
ncbi:hypothetical protein ACH7WL_004245 [Vibrio vulnificus]